MSSLYRVKSHRPINGVVWLLLHCSFVIEVTVGQPAPRRWPTATSSQLTRDDSDSQCAFIIKLWFEKAIKGSAVDYTKGKFWIKWRNERILIHNRVFILTICITQRRRDDKTFIWSTPHRKLCLIFICLHISQLRQLKWILTLKM